MYNKQPSSKPARSVYRLKLTSSVHESALSPLHLASPMLNNRGRQSKIHNGNPKERQKSQPGNAVSRSPKPANERPVASRRALADLANILESGEKSSARTKEKRRDRSCNTRGNEACGKENVYLSPCKTNCPRFSLMALLKRCPLPRISHNENLFKYINDIPKMHGQQQQKVPILNAKKQSQAYYKYVYGVSRGNDIRKTKNKSVILAQ